MVAAGGAFPRVEEAMTVAADLLGFTIHHLPALRHYCGEDDMAITQICHFDSLNLLVSMKASYLTLSGGRRRRTVQVTCCPEWLFQEQRE